MKILLRVMGCLLCLVGVILCYCGFAGRSNGVINLDSLFMLIFFGGAIVCFLSAALLWFVSVSDEQK